MAKDRSLAVRTALRKRYWRERDAGLVVEAWRTSGQGLESFARAHGIGARRVSRWARRLGGEARSVDAAPSSSRTLHFHPVELVRSNRRVGDAAIEVVLADGWRVRVPAGFAAEDLERVLHVLDGRDRC